jgi:hypothetical protein
MRNAKPAGIVPRWALAFLLAALAAVPSAGRADSALDEGMGKLAAAVADFLKTENQASIIVGDFVAPPRLQSSGGPGISQVLTEQFKSKGIAITTENAYQVLGKFQLKGEKESRDADHESIVLAIKATVLDKEDNELQSFNISVFGESAAQLAGLTADYEDRPFPADREEETRDRANAPQAAVVGTESRASASSPFGVEVVVKNGSSPGTRTPTLDSGRPFVDLARGDEYVIRLVNHASFDAAVTLTIDGLSMFAFNQVGKADGQILVAAGTTAEIPGWFCTFEQSEAFLITGYPESAAGQRNVTTGVGTITVSFRAAWEVGSDPPDGEPFFNKGADDIATGRGRVVDKKYTEVKREIGQVRAIVSVRYRRD